MYCTSQTPWNPEPHLQAFHQALSPPDDPIAQVQVRWSQAYHNHIPIPLTWPWMVFVSTVFASSDGLTWLRWDEQRAFRTRVQFEGFANKSRPTHLYLGPDNLWVIWEYFVHGQTALLPFPHPGRERPPTGVLTVPQSRLHPVRARAFWVHGGSLFMVGVMKSGGTVRLGVWDAQRPSRRPSHVFRFPFDRHRERPPAPHEVSVEPIARLQTRPHPLLLVRLSHGLRHVLVRFHPHPAFAVLSLVDERFWPGLPYQLEPINVLDVAPWYILLVQNPEARSHREAIGLVVLHVSTHRAWFVPAPQVMGVYAHPMVPFTVPREERVEVYWVPVHRWTGEPGFFVHDRLWQEQFHRKVVTVAPPDRPRLKEAFLHLPHDLPGLTVDERPALWLSHQGVEEKKRLLIRVREDVFTRLREQAEAVQDLMDQAIPLSLRWEPLDI